MADAIRLFLHAAAGFSAREAAMFLPQMDDQSRRLLEGIRGITPEELEWQPAPGTNSIGMLLAHLAIVEVVWTQVGIMATNKVDVQPVLGLGQDDDGMPIPPDGLAPAHLKGKPLPYYEDLLARARIYLKDAASKLVDADLDREITRTRPDGSQRIFNMRWVFYHSLEHFSGHFGQILLLRHLYRATVPQARA